MATEMKLSAEEVELEAALSRAKLEGLSQAEQMRAEVSRMEATDKLELEEQRKSQVKLRET